MDIQEAKINYHDPVRPCRKCGCIAYRTVGKEFKDGTNHIARYCLDCDAFIDYAAQEIPAAMFVMPYGKYKGRSLAEIVGSDRS